MKKLGTVDMSNDGLASKKFESGINNGCKDSLITKLIWARNVVTKQGNRGGHSSPLSSSSNLRPFFRAFVK